MKNKGFTLIELMIVIAIIAIIAAIAIPGLLQSQRAANERSASASLKTLATAEIDFRSNDRDGNRVNDFWTLDVAGLHYITVGSERGKYIDLSIANADFQKASTIPSLPTGTSLSYTGVTSGAKAGYWYYALNTDGIDGDAYCPTNGYSHNSKFGFGSFPDSLSSGRSLFMINEGATVIRLGLVSSVKPTSGTTLLSVSQPASINPEVWPNDTTITYFGRLD